MLENQETPQREVSQPGNQKFHLLRAYSFIDSS